MKVHIPGCGDHEIASVQALPDPCPPPERDPEKRRRRLNEKGLRGTYCLELTSHLLIRRKITVRTHDGRGQCDI